MTAFEKYAAAFERYRAGFEEYTVALEKQMAQHFAGLQKYMVQYDHEHTDPWNKLMHGVGIPMILAGVVMAVLTWWRMGLLFFVGGWILLFTGHRIEGNKPAFFQGVIYFLVGPIWIAREIWEIVVGTRQESAD